MSSDSDLAISVRGLSKSFNIARRREQDGTASAGGRVGRMWKSLVRRDRRETFLALSDVWFDVKKGEVVGIIGRNGAGKSTLLKILSGITSPTIGEARIYGRVGSLLEVGTGFHPELTGRENIFLNGTILGMRRAEIARQFDAIVDFAGIERFLDTPVKRYSSGMYVRLAFAVAAHLEPEILIVDEVLAVGDAAFQKKCVLKIRDVAQRQGRAVLVVGHNMGVLATLCNRAIHLRRGQVVSVGPAADVLSEYAAADSADGADRRALASRTDRAGDGRVRLTSFHLEDAAGRVLSTVPSGFDVTFVFGCDVADLSTGSRVDVGLSVHTEHQDRTLFVLYSSFKGMPLIPTAGMGQLRCEVPRLPLCPGRYRIGARVTVEDEEADWPAGGVGWLDVVPGDFYRSGQGKFQQGTDFLVDGKWRWTPAGAAT